MLSRLLGGCHEKQDDMGNVIVEPYSFLRQS
jgi:hypothetical protein